MDMGLIIPHLWIMWLGGLLQLSNPKNCVNTEFCEYQSLETSPINFSIFCRSADHDDVRRLFSCFKASKKHFIEEVELRFTTYGDLQVDIFEGLHINSIRLFDVPVSSLNSLEFKGIESLKTLELHRGTLTEIPLSVRSLQNLTFLRVEIQRLKTIPDYSFQEMASLQILSLDINSVSMIGQYTFEGLENLQALSLRKCRKMKYVPTAAFENMRALRTLEFVESEVTHLKPNAFANLKCLNNLYLYSNEISSIDKQAFAGLTELTDLSLRYNRMTSISGQPFRNLAKLKTLALSHNFITELKPNVFLGLTSLELLNLWGNPVSLIQKDAFVGLHALIELLLNKMDLDSIPSDALRNLSTLTYIHFRENKISELNNNSFLGLKSLLWLDLQVNRIFTIHSKAFNGLEESLQFLRLNHQNNLTRIPVEALQSMKRLRQVSFGDLIEYIEADTFKGFGRTIEVIDLSNNRIKSFAESAFHHLPNLESLNLGNNQLYHLDFAVFQPLLNRLEYLTTYGNPLVCSCDLYWYHVLSLNNESSFDRYWFSAHQREHNLTQALCQHDETIINLERECEQKWKPILCNATGLYGCTSGDHCKDEAEAGC